MEVGDQKDGELVTNKSPKKQVRVYPRSSRSKLKNEGDPLEGAEEENPVKTKSKSRTTRSSRKAKTEDSADVVLGSEMNLESIEEEISTNNRTPVSQESAEIENSENTGSDGNRQQHQCGTCPRTFITIRGLRRHSSSCKGLLAKTPSSEAATSEASSSQNKRTALSAKADEVAAATAASIASESMDESMDTYLYDSHHSSDEYYDDDDDDMSSDYMSRSDGPSKKDIGDIIKEIKQFAQVEVEAVEEGLCHCCGEDLTTAHTSGEFKCEECKKHFKFKSSFDRHRRVVHNEGQTYECPECGTRCPDKGTLARHMYTHTGLKPHSCKVCHKTFSRRYHLVRHNMQTGCDGTEKPTFPCQVCGRVFNRKDNLREHLRAHAGQTKRKKSYMCELCGKEFFGTTLLHIHKRTHTGWERPYSCDLCEKKFPSTGAMKKHRRKHTGERPYECKECKARFAAKETLNRHIRTHNGLKPHSCQFCGKRFIQATQLRAHIFHHSGEHGFKCHHCGKSFNRRTRLSLHIKYVHEGAKPFTCNQCDKTFVRKEDLARHKILHTGVKAHKCPICEKDFAMKSSLKIHLLTHTKEPPRSCDECGRAFIRQDCLLRHMRTKHREMLEEIMVEAEKKKLQQQLISAADSDYFDRDPDEPAQVLSQEALAQSITELLSLLVDETTLKAFGWPDESVDHVLESVIRRCGHEPADYADMPYSDKLRENARLLFTVVIDDSVVKTLLNNQTVDEVILHVLRLAKS